MLTHNGRRFRLYPWKVKYQDSRGNDKEKWALPSKEWWESTAQRHNFTVDFEEVELTEEQQKRYDQIKERDIPEHFRTICIDYILDGELPGGNHALRDIEIEQEQEDQDDLLTDILLGRV